MNLVRTCPFFITRAEPPQAKVSPQDTRAASASKDPKNLHRGLSDAIECNKPIFKGWFQLALSLPFNRSELTSRSPPEKVLCFQLQVEPLQREACTSVADPLSAYFDLVTSLVSKLKISRDSNEKPAQPKANSDTCEAQYPCIVMETPGNTEILLWTDGDDAVVRETDLRSITEKMIRWITANSEPVQTAAGSSQTRDNQETRKKESAYIEKACLYNKVKWDAFISDVVAGHESLVSSSRIPTRASTARDSILESFANLKTLTDIEKDAIESWRLHGGSENGIGGPDGNESPFQRITTMDTIDTDELSKMLNEVGIIAALYLGYHYNFLPLLIQGQRALFVLKMLLTTTAGAPNVQLAESFKRQGKLNDAIEVYEHLMQETYSREHVIEVIKLKVILAGVSPLNDEAAKTLLESVKLLNRTRGWTREQLQPYTLDLLLSIYELIDKRNLPSHTELLKETAALSNLSETLQSPKLHRILFKSLVKWDAKSAWNYFQNRWSSFFHDFEWQLYAYEVFDIIRKGWLGKPKDHFDPLIEVQLCLAANVARLTLLSELEYATLRVMTLAPTDSMSRIAVKIKIWRGLEVAQIPKDLTDIIKWMQSDELVAIDGSWFQSEPWNLERIVAIASWYVNNGKLRDWLRIVFSRLPEKPPKYPTAVQKDPPRIPSLTIADMEAFLIMLITNRSISLLLQKNAKSAGQILYLTELREWQPTSFQQRFWIHSLVHFSQLSTISSFLHKALPESEFRRAIHEIRGSVRTSNHHRFIFGRIGLVFADMCVQFKCNYRIEALHYLDVACAWREAAGIATWLESSEAADSLTKLDCDELLSKKTKELDALLQICHETTNELRTLPPASPDRALKTSTCVDLASFSMSPTRPKNKLLQSVSSERSKTSDFVFVDNSRSSSPSLNSVDSDLSMDPLPAVTSSITFGNHPSVKTPSKNPFGIAGREALTSPGYGRFFKPAVPTTPLVPATSHFESNAQVNESSDGSISRIEPVPAKEQPLLDDAPPVAMLDDVLDETVSNLHAEKSAQRRQRAEDISKATSSFLANASPLSKWAPKTPQSKDPLMHLTPGRLSRQLSLLEDLREDYLLGETSPSSTLAIPDGLMHLMDVPVPDFKVKPATQLSDFESEEVMPSEESKVSAKEGGESRRARLQRQLDILASLRSAEI
ncbi:hypothetical protein HDV05_004395 [Chytridiales sp. JEL 0842]|nr:hypothetical protein HDV05_004395 [Chytridiales sp. JEL 0842]